MPIKRIYSGAIAAVNLVFIAYLCAVVVHLTQKADLPEEFRSKLPLVIEGTPVADPDEAEFLLSRYGIGDTVLVSAIDAFTRRPVQLVNYYSLFYILFDIVLAFIIYGLGLFAYLFRPDLQASVIFHLASTSVAASVAGVNTIFSLQPRGLVTV